MEELYCPSIYKGLRILTTGECSSCCMQVIEFKDINNNVLYPYENTFEDILNSHSANEVRKSFQRGEKHSSCDICWKEEAAGIESKRQRDLKYFPELIPETIIDPKKVEVMVLDVNVSNICNLKCRTCSVPSSSSWAMENKIMYPETASQVDSITNKIENTYGDDSAFWAEYKKNFITLKQIDFYGGEPFLVKKQIQILKEVVDSGLSKNINLHFNTNCTVWNDEIFNILKEFKHVNMDISIDGIEGKATYIRHPSNWTNVFNNFKMMYESQKNLDHFLMSVCCSISNLNVFYLDEVLDKMEPYVNVYLNIVYNIDCFSIRWMPEKLKDEVALKIGPSLIKHNKGDKILNFLYSEEYDEVRWNQFIDNTSIFDEHRNEKFSQIFPEFYSLIKNLGCYYGKL